MSQQCLSRMSSPLPVVADGALTCRLLVSTSLRKADNLQRPQSAAVRTGVRCQAARDLSQQMKEMAAAERRWTQQVADGKVKSLTAREAGYNYQLADYVMLDVRPIYERNKAWVKGSLHIPAFDSVQHSGVGSFLDRFTMFIMGGWWSGVAPTRRNERFMADVAANIPKSANIIVCCQKGLRSLAACEHLYKAGHRNIFWLNGGYDTAEDGDFEVEGPESLKLAGIGGMSAFLGFTDVQRLQASKSGAGYRAIFFGRLVLVVLGLDALLISAQQASQLFAGVWDSSK